MRSFSYLAAAASFIACVAAQANPFTMGTIETINAGSPFTITWSPTSSGTITLLLKTGPSTNLKTVTTIASGQKNSGSYVWNPSESIATGDNYALEIVDDSNTNSVNYSGMFSIASDTPAASSVSVSSSSTSVSSSSSSMSSTASSSMTTSMSSSSTASSSSATGSSSSSASKTIKTSSSTASSTSSSATSTDTMTSAAKHLQVGGGMLAIVGAVMLTL